MATVADVSDLDQDLPKGEGSAGPEEDDFVTGALLNKCPDPIKPDLGMAVYLLNCRAAAGEVMKRAGLIGDGGELIGGDDGGRILRGRFFFSEEFRIKCSEVDALVDSLREKEQLSPRLDSLIAGLRLQFGALLHYFSRVHDLKIGEVDKGLGIMEEMRSCDKYPVRIFQNITLMRMMIERASTFEEAHRVYQYLIEDKYEGVNGQEQSVCKPDVKFFKLWSRLCFEPSHCEAIYKEMRVHGFGKACEFLGAMWLRCCRTFDDFEGLNNASIVTEGIYKPYYNFFMIWLFKVRSLDQLLIVIESLFRNKLVPDEELINKIMMVAGIYSGRSGSFVRSFMIELNNIYSNGAYSEITSSKMSIDLYGRLKSRFG